MVKRIDAAFRKTGTEINKYARIGIKRDKKRNFVSFFLSHFLFFSRIYKRADVIMILRIITSSRSG